MTIGLDIDDTLANTFEHMIPYVTAYCGKDAEEMRAKGISYENIPVEWGFDYKVVWRAIFDTAVPLTPLKEGAREAVERIKAAGHKIVIVTARTNEFYTDCNKTTAEELKAFGIPYDKFICSYSKGEACLKEGIDVFLDDSVNNCKLTSGVGVKTYMMASRFNAGVSLPGVKRVKDWSEFLKELGL